MLSEEIKYKIKKSLLKKFSLSKIILFGSQARGSSDSRSDIDLIVISELNESKFSLSNKMMSELTKLNYAFDVIVMTNEEFERDKKYPGNIARYASKEGIILYEK